MQKKSHLSPETTASPLVVRYLNKRYRGGPWANRDISFIAKPGEILGVLGPNGAGKTTLVRQITTELLPTSGEIKVVGLDVVSEANAVKSHLGVMPQEAVLFDYLTVYQHLRIFGKLRGLSSRCAARRADELVIELGLIEHRDVPIIKTSGGMRRRLLVGIAALAKPLLLVLDEPTTGLDPEARRMLWGLLNSFREAGTTVLLTTHYMEEAEALCDRVGIIQQGQLLALDTVDNLRSQYGYEFKITYSLDTDTGDKKTSDSRTRGGVTGEPLTIYGADEQGLVDQVRSLRARQISLSRTSLEDVYFALTREKELPNDRTD